MVEARYQAQMDLLLRVLPHVFRENVFALKGGTAINVFFRGLPRLSVDIDLAYLPIEPREDTLINIGQSLDRIAQRLKSYLPMVNRVTKKKDQGNSATLFVEGGGALVKIEPNRVIRGSAFPCEDREMHRQATEIIGEGAYAKGQVLSLADLFGGKICAALDRQHPRDLFDVHLLFDEEGFSPAIRKAFVVYLISHDRPIRELLEPRPKDIRRSYERELEGMMRDPIPVSSLEKTFSRLVHHIHNDLTNDERKFILSFKEGLPHWDWLGVFGAEKLPAPAWKLANIRKMDAKKHREAYQELKRILER